MHFVQLDLILAYLSVYEFLSAFNIIMSQPCLMQQG